MSAITATQNTTSTTALPDSTSAISGDQTEDRFLKLLVAQMKNQDPLNPLDNAQVTSQMAQISTVQGLTQLNTSMTNMLTQFQGSQAISLPGHQVLLSGNTIDLAAAATGSSSAASAKGGFDLDGDADKVGVDIKDATGAIVAHLDLGAQSAGAGSFQWDGTDGKSALPSGKYTFEVTATKGGASVNATTLRAARVMGTAITAQGVRLSLEGLDTAYYSDVKMVL